MAAADAAVQQCKRQEQAYALQSEAQVVILCVISCAYVQAP
jgi:hypothetical protein